MSNRSWNDGPLVQLTLQRVREFVREPEALFWTVAFPMLLAGGLGLAFRTEPVEVIRVAASTPELAAALRQDRSLDVAALSPEEAQIALRNGEVLLVAEPADDAPGVVYRYDDTNPEARGARNVADRAIQVAAGRMDPVAATDDVRREVGSRYIDFLVPGLVGMGIMSNSVWGLGFAIVDARRRKLMKRIMATPMPRQLYLSSFLVWRMLLLGVEVGVPVVFGALVFGVPVRGSVAELLVIAALGSVSFSALGLLIAARARTIEGVSGLMNLVLLPMWICSGVFFSAQRFPDAVQPIVKALPLTALIDALRANMLQGAPLTALAPELGVMIACLVLSFALAMKLFRWR